MKKLLLIFPLTCTLLTGCAWLRDHPQAPAAIAQQAGSTITRELLVAHSDWKTHFVKASADLAELETRSVLAASDVIEILQRIPAKELKSTTARIVIDGLSLTIMLTGNPTLPAETTTQIKEIVHGLRLGINMALGGTTLPPNP